MDANDYETKESLAAQLAHALRKVDELERARRRVGISFRRVPESGAQIKRLYAGDFPYLQHIPALSYSLADRHKDEAAASKALSTAIDGNITLIEGDNLPVLAALQLTHKGRVDVIYIDPPYNTGNNDFIYNDARKSSVSDVEGATLEDYEVTLDGKARAVGRDDPERHSLWLSFMEKRLYLAKELLSDTGVIFVSIDDNEQARLKLLMDEVFGEQNFVSNMIWKKKQGGGNDSSNIVAEHEYVITFSKSASFSSLLDTEHAIDAKQYPLADEKGSYSLIRLDKPSLPYLASLDFPIFDYSGTEYLPRVVNGKQSRWRWGKVKVAADSHLLVFKNGGVFTKNYLPTEGIKPKSLLVDTRFGRSETGNDNIKSVLGHDKFSFPKPISLIKHLLRISALPNATVLDFFAGSGTTGHAVAELNKEDGGNRQCILVTHGDENGKNIAEDVTALRMKRVLSGLGWADVKDHDGLNGELNYYKLSFAAQTKNPEDMVSIMQTKFAGFAALQQDVVVLKELTQFQTRNFSLMGSSTKLVVLVKDEDYLLDDSDEFFEVLAQLFAMAAKYEELYGIRKELIVYSPTSDDDDVYDFASHGWFNVPYPLHYLRAHAKLVDKMKKNKTLLPPLTEASEQADATNIEGAK